MAKKVKEISPTQEIIDLDYIKNDTVVLKNGSLRKILLVSAVNFDLKSEEEQNLLVFGYQEFLNSLSGFSTQILVHSRKLNIEGYLKRVDTRVDKEPSSLLKNILKDYRDFVGKFVADNPIMSKTFFVVVPYDPVKVPEVGKKTATRFMGLFGKKIKEPTEADKTAKFEEYLKQLELRVDQVVSGLNRFGLRVVPLAEAEITELFYNFYNPGIIERKGVALKRG